MEVFLAFVSTFFMIVTTIIAESLAKSAAKHGVDVGAIEAQIAKLHRQIDANLAIITEATNELNRRNGLREPTGPPVEYQKPDDLLTELGCQRIQRPARFDAEGKWREN